MMSVDSGMPAGMLSMFAQKLKKAHWLEGCGYEMPIFSGVPMINFLDENSRKIVPIGRQSSMLNVPENRQIPHSKVGYTM